jgi:hypothetical protein
MTNITYSPHQINFGTIAAGQTRTLGLTVAKARHSEGASARITQDNSGGLFKIQSLDVFEVEYWPPGPNGRPIDMTLVDHSDGSTPVSVNEGNMVKVKVTFTAPTSGSDYSFSANLMVQGWAPGTTIPAVPMYAGIGRIQTRTMINSIDIKQDDEGSIPITITSLEGPDTEVHYQLVQTPDLSGITMDPVSVFVPQGASRDLNLHFKVSYQASPGIHYPIVQEFAFETLGTGGIIGYGQTDVIDPAPQINITKSTMVTWDDNVQWYQPTLSGILRDDNQQAWHAGRVNDMLPLDDLQTIYLATDSGGIWHMYGYGVPDQISDRILADPTKSGLPKTNCLAFSPDSNYQFYAGCQGKGGLYQFGVNNINLQLIEINDVNGHSIETGDIIKIVILKHTRKIVLACKNGVFWSDVPIGNNRFKSFTKVSTLIEPDGAVSSFPEGAYSGLAIGPNNSIMVAAWGSDPNKRLYGLFYGNWLDGQNLVMRRARIYGDVDEKKMYRTSVASCDSQPMIAYAVVSKSSSDEDKEWMYCVLRTTNGGADWLRITTNVIDMSVPLESKDPDVAGGQGNYNNCIAVCPHDSAIVAIGWRNGPYISKDRGYNWYRHTDSTSTHLHEDIHGLCFNPFNPSGRTLYICSDGGLAITKDLGDTFSTYANRQLSDLQFRSFSASPTISGLIAGSTQDNGNIYCILDPNLTSAEQPWRTLEEGDGESCRFISTGHLLRYNNTLTLNHREYGIMVRVASWNPNTRQFEGGSINDVIPVDGTNDGLADPILEAISSPVFQLDNQIMLAIGAGLHDVYGLFANPDGSHMHWRHLTFVNGSDNITSIGSADGNTVFIGTSSAFIYSCNTRDGTTTSMVVPQALKFNGSIYKLLIRGPNMIFAIHSLGKILHYDDNQWKIFPGPPDEVLKKLELPSIMSLDIDPTTNKLFAATRDQVYSTIDNGATWKRASWGLPANSQCNELHFIESDGKRFLYLSTWGRSIWRAGLST